MCTHRVENTEEKNRFLEIYELPKFNQEDMAILINSISGIEIENVVKNLPTKKSPGPDGFMAEFYKKFRANLMQILL